MNCPGSGRISLKTCCDFAKILWLIVSKGVVFMTFLGHWSCLSPLASQVVSPRSPSVIENVCDTFVLKL